MKSAAIQIIQKLRQSGHEALLAGGCVRDLLLGREPKDYDVATSATPRAISAFPRGKEPKSVAGTMTATGSLAHARADHTATLLSDKGASVVDVTFAASFADIIAGTIKVHDYTADNTCPVQ